DYIADLGGRRSASGLEALYARSRVVLAARLSGLHPIDQAVMEPRETARFEAHASAGRDLGYRGKICIHPSQVAAAHHVFTPSASEVGRARAVLDAIAAAGAAGGAGGGGGGVMLLGLMIDPAADPAGTPAQARTAEQLGFDFVACGEHVFFHGPVSNAFVGLSAAAAVTDRGRLVSALTVLPLYPAALVAKMAASLDRLSGGRFTLGVGVGGEYPAEFAACGAPVQRRGAKADESLTVLRSLLGGQAVTLNGEFAQLDGLTLQPPPVQQPLPIWVGGRAAAAQRRAGRFGDAWLPYMVTPQMLARGLESVRGFAASCGRPAGAVSGAVFL